MSDVIIGFLVIAIVDLPLLIKMKKRSELVAFICIFIAGFAIAILYEIGVTVPSPMVVMGDIMKKIHLSY